MTKLWKLEAGRKKTDRFACIKKKKSLYMEGKNMKTHHQKRNQKASNKVGENICNVYDGQRITMPNVKEILKIEKRLTVL